MAARGTILNQDDMELVDEPVAGFYESLVFVVLDETDDIATFATDKALIDVLFLVDVHGGMLVGMIPACGSSGELAHTIERDTELGANFKYR